MAQIAAWVATNAPRLMVVDVSVEVAVLVRTMGVPTVVMGMPGTRDDRAHQLAYRMADAIIAPWPAWAPVFGGGAPWRAKTHTVGAISRFDGRRRSRQPSGGSPRVLVLSGRGGTELTVDMLAAAERATPGWTWTVLGPPGTRWVDDPWPLLCSADVIVTHAGQNAIADVAASRRPAVVIAQPRPHDEQLATARALHDAQLAVVRPSWPAPEDWRAVLEAAVRAGRQRLGALEHRDGRRAGRDGAWESWHAHRGDHDRRRPPRPPPPPVRRPATGPSSTWSSRWATARRSAAGGSSAIRATSSVWACPRKVCRSPARATPVPSARWTAGAELLVFLDVDCIPGAALLQRYGEAAADERPRAAVRARRLPSARSAASGYRADGPAHARLAAPRAPDPAGGRGPARRRSRAVLDAVLRGHRQHLAPARRVLRGLRRLRRRGHRLRPGRRPRRRRSRLGRRSLGLPPAPRDRDPARPPPRRHPPQRRALSPALGLVADGRLALGVRRTRPGPPRPRPPIAGSRPRPTRCQWRAPGRRVAGRRLTSRSCGSVVRVEQDGCAEFAEVLDDPRVRRIYAKGKPDDRR